jgi:hypothetical protein
MRLARTAAPLPRESGRLESNQRSPDPKSGGMPSSLQPDVDESSTAGGSRTRASGLRARRHHRFDHGGKGSGGRDRTCASRVTVARLPDSTTPEWNGGKTRTCERRGAAYALATRCLSSSAMPPRGGRRGSRTPKAREPTRFRDGVPRQWQSFRMAPAGVEPAPSRVRTGSSPS